MLKHTLRFTRRCAAALALVAASCSVKTQSDSTGTVGGDNAGGGGETAGGGGETAGGGGDGGGDTAGEPSVSEAGAGFDPVLSNGGSVDFGSAGEGSILDFAGSAGEFSGPGIDPCRPIDGEAGVQLLATVRDFKIDHMDFETTNTAPETGLVERKLGADRKPVYAGIPSQTVTSQESFDRWYRDVPGVNIPIRVALTLVQTPEYEGFDSSAYFPIDGLGFGNEEYAHNYSFTTEIHTLFIYKGGETFSFAGDDDVWVFINNTLVIDLGGVHPEESATLNLDQVAKMLGLERGMSYPMDLFHAERHTVGSNFRIQSDLSFTKCTE